MNRFIELAEGEKGEELHALGEKIKKLDRDNDRRMRLTIVLSIISMTVLGFFAFGIIGALIFFGITATASFALFYSSKKNILLKYLAFYRSKVPALIAEAEGISVKSEEIPCPEFVSSLSSKGRLAYRMSHNYNGLYIAYAKFMQGSEPILQGLLYYTDAKTDDTAKAEELFSSRYDGFIIKSEKGKALAFIPGVGDYLNGRIEMKDDLDIDSLCYQYEFYLLGKEFRSLMN